MSPSPLEDFVLPIWACCLALQLNQAVEIMGEINYPSALVRQKHGLCRYHLCLNMNTCGPWQHQQQNKTKTKQKQKNDVANGLDYKSYFY